MDHVGGGVAADLAVVRSHPQRPVGLDTGGGADDPSVTRQFESDPPADRGQPAQVVDLQLRADHLAGAGEPGRQQAVERGENSAQQACPVDRRAQQVQRRRVDPRQVASIDRDVDPGPDDEQVTGRSARIPAILASSTRTSLGHLSPAGTPSACSADTRATPSSAPIHPRRAGGTCGTRNATLNSSAVPGGADQLRPSRPRPAVCASATSTERSAGPAAIRSVLVEPATAANRTAHRGPAAACSVAGSNNAGAPWIDTSQL